MKQTITVSVEIETEGKMCGNGAEIKHTCPYAFDICQLFMAGRNRDWITGRAFRCPECLAATGEADKQEFPPNICHVCGLEMTVAGEGMTHWYVCGNVACSKYGDPNKSLLGALRNVEDTNG